MYDQITHPAPDDSSTVALPESIYHAPDDGCVPLRAARSESVHHAPDDEVVLHIRCGHVVAEAGPISACGRTLDEAMDRLNEARQLYLLLLVRPNSPAALRLANKINELYAA